MVRVADLDASLDFYCNKAKLVIEIDGASHDMPGQAEYDAERQSFLESLGLCVLRFSNSQVLNQPDFVLKAIYDYVASLP